MKKKINILNKLSFKKRYSQRPEFNLANNGDFSLYLINSVRLEIVKIVKLKRFLKKFFKKNKIFKKKKVWIYLSKNCPISKKAKNSRMGKGKGKFLRYVLKFKPNHPLISFKGLPHNRCKAFFNKLRHRNYKFVYSRSFIDSYRLSF